MSFSSREISCENYSKYKNKISEQAKNKKWPSAIKPRQTITHLELVERSYAQIMSNNKPQSLTYKINKKSKKFIFNHLIKLFHSKIPFSNKKLIKY